jgi:hypothetical protein
MHLPALTLAVAPQLERAWEMSRLLIETGYVLGVDILIPHPQIREKPGRDTQY